MRMIIDNYWLGSAFLLHIKNIIKPSKINTIIIKILFFRQKNSTYLCRCYHY